MSLSRSHRRAVFGGAGISLVAALLVPALAQFHATKKAAAPITVAPASATSTHLVKVSDVIRDLQARIDRKQALAAGEPHKSAKEAEEEFHEETRDLLQRFRKSLHEKSGKALAEAEEEHEGPASTQAEQALLYRLVTRFSADDVVDPDAMLRAIQQRDAMKPAAVRGGQPNAQAVAAGQGGANGDHSIRVNAIVPPTPGPPTIVPDPNAKWQLVGPRNGISQQHTGRVNAVAYDVRNPGRVFCGGAKGGVWKSNDYGTTWTPKTDYMAGLSISGITIDPNNSNVVYAGTGDYDQGAEFPGIVDMPFGLLKSTDGGETWSVTGRGLPTREPIHKILVDPRNSSIVYATCGFFGLYKSINAGATWTGITINFLDFDDSGNPLLDPVTGQQIVSTDGGRVSDIVFTSNQTELVVSTDAYNTRGGIYSSFNGGASWGINLGVSKKPLKTLGRFDVAASLSAASSIGANGQFFGAPGRYDPGTLYVIDGGAQMIYKRLYTLIVPATNQYGYLWTQVSNPTGASWGQAGYDIYIAAGALDRIFVGLVNFHVSIDGGATFIMGNPGHTDQHAISIVNLNQYILGNDGGAWLGTLVPSGTTTTSIVQTLNQNLYLTQFYFGAYNPVNVNGFLGGSQDNASPYTNDGANWPQVPTGDGGGSVINQDQPGTQYTSSYNTKVLNPTGPSIFPVFRTDDAWNTTFRDISVNVLDDNIPFLATIKANLADPSLIYLGTNFLWQYNANTNAWNQLTQEFTNNTRGAFVLSIGTSPQNKNVIYTGTTNGFVWYSQNGGQTFNNITANLSGAPVSSLFVSPTNPQKVYATIEGAPGRGRPHVFRCDNANAPTWVNISSNLPDTYHQHAGDYTQHQRAANLCGNRHRRVRLAGCRSHLGQCYATARIAQRRSARPDRCAGNQLPDGLHLRAQRLAVPAHDTFRRGDSGSHAAGLPGR